MMTTAMHCDTGYNEDPYSTGTECVRDHYFPSIIVLVLHFITIFVLLLCGRHGTVATLKPDGE